MIALHGYTSALRHAPPPCSTPHHRPHTCRAPTNRRNRKMLTKTDALLFAACLGNEAAMLNAIIADQRPDQRRTRNHTRKRRRLYNRR